MVVFSNTIWHGTTGKQHKIKFRPWPEYADIIWFGARRRRVSAGADGPMSDEPHADDVSGPTLVLRPEEVQTPVI